MVVDPAQLCGSLRWDCGGCGLVEGTGCLKECITTA
jgi:hypothetical protein